MIRLACCGIAVCLTVSACSLTHEPSSDVETLANQLSANRADAQSIIETLKQMHVETTERDQEDATARLMDEKLKLKDSLLDLQQRISSDYFGNDPEVLALRKMRHQKEKRKNLIRDIVTLRFQIALERYMIQDALRSTGEKQDPNNLIQPTSQGSEVDR